MTHGLTDRPGAADLALVPGLEAGARPLHLARLEGGTVNESWRVDTNQGRFVLRLDGEQWRRPGVDRPRERSLHRLAAEAGIAPRLLAVAASGGAQVCEYIEGRCWQAADLAAAEQLERLGARLARLHALSPPRGLAAFDPGACAREYLRLADPALAAAAGAPRVAAAVEAAAARVSAEGVGLRPVHGDLVHGNLLAGKALMLLDWEYAQVADPCYDAACVLAYYPAARQHERRLLAAAGLDTTGPGAAALRRRLQAATYVYQALTWLWHLARGERVPLENPYAPLAS